VTTTSSSTASAIALCARLPLGERCSLTAEAREHGLALELARLDELQRTFYEKPLGSDIACALVEKIIARRCVMLGLHAPQTAVLKIVDEATPKETSIDKIERVLAEFAAQKKDEPTSH